MIALAQLNTAINSGDGSRLARTFRLSLLLEQKDQCSSLKKELNNYPFTDRTINWKSLFSNLFSVPLADSPEAGYVYYDKASTIFFQQFTKLPNSIKIPIMKEISHSFREFASTCEFNGCVQKLRSYLPLTQRVREEAYSEEGSPLLAVVNDLICLFLERNDFKQANTLFAQIIGEAQNREGKGLFTAGELATFYFNGGKISTVMGYTIDALNFLRKALNLTPLSQERDRRLIYAILLPNELSLGSIPSDELVEKYGLQVYSGLVDAIVDMDLEGFDRALDENMLTFVRLGVWDVCAKSKIIIYRRILESVCTVSQSITNDNKVDLELFRRACSLGREHTMEEAETILAGLVAAKLVYANISDAAKKFIVKKENPFPPLPLEN